MGFIFCMYLISMVARVKAFLFELFDSYERTINFWLLLVLLTCAFPVSIFPAE